LTDLKRKYPELPDVATSARRISVNCILATSAQSFPGSNHNLSTQPAGIEVLRADTPALRRAFLQLPHRIYAQDPHWVAPLDLELRQRLWGGNPFFEHAVAQAWVAMRGEQCVGRISAQYDRLHQQVHGNDVGSFGLIEMVDDADVVSALLQTAADWLRTHHATRMRGPLNLSVNEECGLLVEGFDTPPSIMMGHACPGYDQLLQQQGLLKARDLLAYRVAPDFVAPGVMRRLADSLGKKVRVRALDTRDKTRELEIVRDIFNDAWSENFGFVPFTEAEFQDIGKLLTLLMPPDYVQLAEVDGEPAAFIVAMPNINEITAHLRGRLLPLGWLRLLWGLKVRHPRSARVSLMGVRKKFQQSRLGPGLAFMVIDAVRKRLCANGVTEVELSWILEDNSGMRSIIESIGGEPYKRYRIYEKAI